MWDKSEAECSINVTLYNIKLTANTDLFFTDTERPEHNTLDEFGDQQQDTADCVYHHLYTERQNNTTSFNKDLTVL